MPDSPDNMEEPHLPLSVQSPVYWAEVLIDGKALREYYYKKGIKCFDCCAAEKETFATGAKVHEGGPHGAFDPQKVVDDLNELAKEHPRNPDDKPPTLLGRIMDMLFSAKPE